MRRQERIAVRQRIRRHASAPWRADVYRLRLSLRRRHDNFANGTLRLRSMQGLWCHGDGGDVGDDMLTDDTCASDGAILVRYRRWLRNRFAPLPELFDQVRKQVTNFLHIALQFCIFRSPCLVDVFEVFHEAINIFRQILRWHWRWWWWRWLGSVVDNRFEIRVDRRCRSSRRRHADCHRHRRSRRCGRIGREDDQRRLLKVQT